MPFRGVFPADKFVPAPYGLFSVANVKNHTGTDEHWAGGFEFESEMCRVNGSLVDVCGGPEIPVIVADDDPTPKVQPFAIRAEDECLSQGWAAQDRKARVLRQLEMITEKMVEAELMTGAYSRQLDEVAPPNQFLASTNAVDVTGGAPGVTGAAVKPAVGLALLEQALSQCGPGAQGVIHAPASLGAVIGDKGGQGDDKTLRTFNGNLIAIGSGYDGRGPGETTPPANYFTPWIYATGPVAVDLGPAELVTPDFRSATNAATNVMTFVAVRPASVYWDGCCHFAVQVDLRL